MPRPSSRFWRSLLRLSVPAFAAAMLLGYVVYSQRLANPPRMMHGSKSTPVLEDFSKNDTAPDQWAIENHQTSGPMPARADGQKDLLNGTPNHANAGGEELLPGSNSSNAPYAGPTMDPKKYRDIAHRLLEQAAPSSRTAVDEIAGGSLSIDFSITPPKPILPNLTRDTIMMSSSKFGPVVRPAMIEWLLPDGNLGPPIEGFRLASEITGVTGTKPVQDPRIDYPKPPETAPPPRTPRQILEDAEPAEKSNPLLMAGSKSAPIFNSAKKSAPDLTLHLVIPSPGLVLPANSKSTLPPSTHP